MISVIRSGCLTRSTLLVVLVLVVAAPAVCAQGVFGDSSLQAELKLIIQPEQSGLELDVWVDRQEYTVGDSVTIYARTNKNAYIYIFNVSPKGEVYPIIPSPREQDNYIRSGQILRLPRGSYRITANTAGVEHLIAIATLKPINPDSYWVKRAMDTAELGKPFNSTPEELLERLKWSELRPFHYGAYAATVISFVVRDPHYSRLGNLSVSSVPSGAMVFVDGRHAGATPCAVRDLMEGYHEVTLVKEGYRTVVDLVAIRARATEYKSYTPAALDTQIPAERVVFGPWRVKIERERDDDTRSFAADLGYSGVIQIRPKETFDSKLYQIEGLLTVRPGETTSQAFLLLADSASQSDRGKTITKTVGPFRVLTTIEDIDVVDRGSVFSSRYFKSVTLSIQVVWVGTLF